MGLAVFIPELKRYPFNLRVFPLAVKSCPKMERQEYFRVDREWKRVDGRLAEGARCLLWGEPGLRCFGAVAFLFHELSQRKNSQIDGPELHREIVPKMERQEYFRVDRQWKRVDGRLGGEQSACCGVNLAFAALEGVGSFWHPFGVLALGVEFYCLRKSSKVVGLQC
jgi:hypothetical protein